MAENNLQAQNPASETCSILTLEGIKLLDASISNAIAKIAYYGVHKTDAVNASLLENLLKSTITTSADLEQYRVADVVPIAGYFDKDQLLTVRTKLNYGDLKKRDYKILGFAILSNDDKVVGLYPHVIMLENEQASSETLIKFTHKMGQPGTVLFYSGEYLTREEYDAKLVTVVNETTEKTIEHVKPQLDTALTDFKAREDKAFEGLAEQFDALQKEATRDLTGMQDLLGLTAWYVSLITVFRDNLKRQELMLRALKAKLDEINRRILVLKQEYDELGEHALFIQTLPPEYIMYNRWYETDEYKCFVEKFSNVVVYDKSSPQGRKYFMIRWKRNNIYGDVPIDGFYPRISLNPNKYDFKQEGHQRLPSPFTSETEILFPTWAPLHSEKWTGMVYDLLYNYGRAYWPLQLVVDGQQWHLGSWPGNNKDTWFHPGTYLGKPYKGQDGKAPAYNTHQENLTYSPYYTSEPWVSENNNRWDTSGTYDYKLRKTIYKDPKGEIRPEGREGYKATVETEHSHILLGVKAKPRYKPQEYIREVVIADSLVY